MECTSAAGAMPPSEPWCSTSSVRAPSRAAETAAANPALPPPATRTSTSIDQLRSRFAETIFEDLRRHQPPLFIAENAFAPRERDGDAAIALAEEDPGARRRAEAGQVKAVDNLRPGELADLGREGPGVR